MKNEIALNAIDKAAEGFKTAAAKKRVLETLNREYERNIYDTLHNLILAAYDAGLDRDSELGLKYHNVYWDLPNYLSQVREKKFWMFEIFENTEFKENLIDLLDAAKIVKDTEVVRNVKPESEKVAAAVKEVVYKTLTELKEDFAWNVDLCEILGMNVYCNAHWVRHAQGTEFIRHFFYLNGKLTALNMIIAVSEKIQRNEKEKNG